MLERKSGWSLALWHGGKSGEAPAVEVTRAETGEPWLHIESDTVTLVVGPAGGPAGEHVVFSRQLVRGVLSWAMQLEAWAHHAGADVEEGQDR